MSARSLPSRPNLDQYKKQAKDLLKEVRSGNPDARARVRQNHPRLVKLPESRLAATAFALADAQLVIAREHGFDSWPKFAQHIEALVGTNAPAAVWKRVENAVMDGDAAALERLLHDHEQMLRRQSPRTSWLGNLALDGLGNPRADAGLDARSIIAAKHHFEDWHQFAALAEALNVRTSPVAQFEAAVDAVVAGDLTTLDRRLRQNPDLIRARSTRTHHSTLLHYVGANGVEGFRQRTPKNAVQIAETLLDAGAELDSVADMYRGTTTLGLVATSVHPVQAGVQGALIDLLLERGASLDRAVAPDYTDGRVVNACLANGRGEGAEYLAERGARLDLEGAAGVGRLDVVTRFFNEDGSLRPDSTLNQMRSGFKWACGYGRLEVVDFLLGRGVDAAERHRGETGLHHAALGGRIEIVKLLLERGAPVDIKDETWSGTPLDWALHGWGNSPPEGTPDRYYETVALLVGAGATVDPGWLSAENLRDDPRMLAALRRA